MKIYLRETLSVLAIFSILVIMAYGYDTNGGGSLKSSEPYGNIIKYEVRNGNLITDKPAEYSFSSPEFGIYKILVYSNNNEYDIPVRVEYLRESSKLANNSPPGIIYRNENVIIGSKRIAYITVKFRVKNSWFKENDIDLNGSNIPHLLKWNGADWSVLKTNMIKDEGIYTYFEVPNAGNSNIGIFAISAPQKDVQSNMPSWPVSISYAKEDKENNISVNETDKKSSGFGSIVSIIVIILLFGYKTRKRYLI